MEAIPLPPTVPYTGNAWPYKHFGFPSTWALDEDRVAVAIGRKHSTYWHGAEKTIME